MHRINGEGGIKTDLEKLELENIFTPFSVSEGRKFQIMFKYFLLCLKLPLGEGVKLSSIDLTLSDINSWKIFRSSGLYGVSVEYPY